MYPVAIIVTIVTCFVFKNKFIQYAKLKNVIVKLWSNITDMLPVKRYILPPGTTGLPFIGEMLHFLNHTDASIFFQQKTAKYGKIYKTHLFFKPTICTCDIDHVRKVLRNEHTLVKGTWPPTFRRLMGDGALSMSSPENHRIKHRLLVKSFNKKDLQDLFPLIQNTIVTALHSWTKSPHVDVYKSIKLLAFTSTCEVLLGINPSPSDIKKLSENFQDFIGGIFTIPVNIPGFSFHKAMKARISIRQHIKHLIETKLTNQSPGTPPGILGTFLTNSLENHIDLNLEEVLDIAVELLFGGQETSTSVMTQFIVLMKQYPEILQEFKKEIYATDIGVNGENLPNVSPINQLKYTTATIKEILRLFPPIGGGFREVIETFELGEYTIPKGWVISYAIPETHKFNNSAADVNTFNPDRWLTKESAKQTEKCYLPFGSGARACVGKQYATILIQAFIVYAVKFYDWEIVSPNEVKFISFPVRHPESPILCEFKERKY